MIPHDFGEVGHFWGLKKPSVLPPYTVAQAGRICDDVVTCREQPVQPEIAGCTG